MNAKEFLKQVRHDDIIEAVRRAETRTSGEIRVFISHKNMEDAVGAAQAAFVRMGMAKTPHRNGVLIFVAPKARQFAVIGDEGVHQKCGDVFWQALAAEMSGHFKKSDFTGGILHGILKAGELLAKHFPRRDGEKDDLPNRVEHD
jgi:uncharacterized membrane protein